MNKTEGEEKVLCAICGELKEGDFFYPDEEYYCYDCLEKIEREEEAEQIDEEWLEAGSSSPTSNTETRNG